MPTEEEKKASAEYGFNPVSRRWVKKTSDTWLRLVKAGVVGEDPELLEALTLKRREAVREKNQAAVERRAKLMAPTLRVVAEPKPEPSKPEPTPVRAPVAAAAPKKPTRSVAADIRRRVIRTALDHQSELDGCQDDDELEERLRRLLLAPSAKPRRDKRQQRHVSRATHARLFDGTSASV